MTPDKYDAILVLGVSTDPRLFRSRVDRAVDLFAAGAAPLVIFSGRHWGGLKQGPRTTEAALMRQYAVDRGLPKAATRVETRSLNTIGNFYFVRTQFLDGSGLRSLLVVTQAGHLPKARFLARKILGPSYTVSWSTVLDSFRATAEGHIALKTLKAVFPRIRDGDLIAVRRLLGRHPYYKRYRTF